MKINDKYFFFDVDRQCYVELTKDNKVKRVTKKYIKSEFVKELKKMIPDKVEMLKELKKRLQLLFLIDIESVIFYYDPNRSKKWIEGGYLCLNLFYKDIAKLSEKRGYNKRKRVCK